MRLGVHTSIAGGIELSIERAKRLGCNTLQIFCHNPRNWTKPIISDESLQKFRKLRELYDMNPVFIHCSYLINIASGDRTIRNLSKEMLIWELRIGELLKADYLVLHPGSASMNKLKGKELAKRILKSINELKPWNIKILLENTAGEKGDISSTIEELAELLDASGNMGGGICLDTCHAFQAGYDLRSLEGIEQLSLLIKNIIGHGKVKLIHLNDSKRDFSSRVDRHEHIGKGKIGESGFKRFLNHPDFRGIPVILETPKKSDRDDIMNLRTVRRILNL